ncbi:hypothetical protein PsorP6_008991 [Peronosclerospora sorghi]|uniref:Uncharacterized protein n=1 Tax=Peronosclerospora sorghi TaxID=230839 RepID=A0ACC0W0L0_9STRA|nr:hypothetical protein PsorP6_008991 [Peronosclerospora sorghi]
MRASSKEAGESDVDSLLRLVRAHQQQHDDSEYEANSPAAIHRCKTMLTKLRKLLPKLMRPVATLSIENAVPVLRNLCQLLTLLLDGKVCPHSMSIFMESNTNAAQGANGTSSGFPSYPTMATMMFYMVSFYTNDRFCEAQRDVRNVTLLMVSFLQRNDVYAFIHFFHDTLRLLEDCFLLEETLNRRKMKVNLPGGTTIACYLDTAIHVYQDADGPLGGKSNVILCGCMSITDTTQLDERREQLKQLLPSIVVSSYEMLVVLRQSIIDLVNQLIRQHSAIVEETHHFDRLCRTVELFIVKNEVNIRTEYQNDAVSNQKADEATRSTLRLLYTMLEVSARTERRFVSLTLVYMKSSVLPTTNAQILKAWASIVKLVGGAYSRLSTFVLDALWLPFERWVDSNLQFVRSAPREDKETIAMAVLKILGVYIKRSNTSRAATLFVKLLETLDLRVSCPALTTSVISGFHRVLATKEMLMKVVCYVSKKLICTNPDRTSGPTQVDTVRKRKRSEMSSSRQNWSDFNLENSTELSEKLGEWILNLFTIKNTDQKVVEATSISLRVILPLRRYIVTFAPLESFSLFQALFQRVDLILNTYAPSLTPLTSEYLDLWIILLRYYDNHELDKYRDLLNKVMGGIETQQIFARSVEQAKDFVVPDCWDYMAFLELYRHHVKCHDMSASENLDEVSLDDLRGADAVLDSIFRTSTVLRGPFLIYFVWSRPIVLNVTDEDSWRNAAPWKFIHRSLVQETSLDVIVCSYLAMTPLIAFFGVAESLTSSKKLITCVMEIFCDKIQCTKSEVILDAVTKACGAVLCAAAYGRAFAGGTKYLDDEKLDVASRAKTCHCRMSINRVQVNSIPLALFELIICNDTNSATETIHVARIHALSSVFEHCEVDFEKDLTAIRFMKHLLTFFAGPSELAHQAVLDSIVHRPRLFNAMVVKPTEEGSGGGLMERLETLMTAAKHSPDDRIVVSMMQTYGTIGCECDPIQTDRGENCVSILLKLVFLWNRFCIGHRSRCAAAAYDQIYRITSHHRVSWRELCFEFPTLLYFPLVDELLNTKTLKLFLRTFLGGKVDTKVFLRASAPYVLPKYVVHQNERMLHTFTDELNGVKEDVAVADTSQEGDSFITITDLLNNHIGYVLKDLIMHQVQALTNPNRLAEIEFLFQFLPENSTVRDVILHSPFQLMNLLAWELGGPQYRVAKRAIREVAKYLHEDSREAEIEQHGSLQLGVGCMPRRYLLALMTDLGNRISGTKSMAFKIRAIKSIDRLLEVFSGGSADSNSIQSTGLVDPFVPKVMATLKVGLLERKLQEYAITAWGNFLRMLSAKALEANLSSIVVSMLPCLGHDASSILIEDSSISGSQCWNLETLEHARRDDGGHVKASRDLDNCRTKCMVAALEILRYLFIEKQSELKAAFPTIPLLPSIPELDEIYVALYENDGDPICRPLSEYLMNLSAYVNHVDGAVREVALAQLLRCLVTRGAEFEELMQNEGNLFIPDAIVAVVQSVLHLSRTESQESIKLLCARCLGGLGAIDSARMPLNMFSTTRGPHGGAMLAKEKSCQKIEHSTKDLACVLIEAWLVKELRAAPENTDALALAIQELLKFLAELTADPQHSGQSVASTKHASSLLSHTRPQTSRTSMPEWMKRRFERKNVLQFVEPYWSTNYSVSSGRPARQHASSSSERQSHASADPSLYLTRTDISLYEKYGTSYEEWLLMWCRRLIHLSQPPERKIFWACKTALPKSPQIARFILPYLIQNVLRSGKSDVGEELKKEVMAVLNGQDCGIFMDNFLMTPPESKHGTDSTGSESDTFYRHDQCCQTIFSTIDELNDWIWTSEKKRLALSSSAASRHTSASCRSEVPSEVDDHEKDYLEEFLKEIPIRTLSSAAYKIKAYARALQYFEIYLRQEEFPPTDSMDMSVETKGPVHLSLIAKNAFYLQQLYKSIDEPDALLGLASLRRFHEASRPDAASDLTDDLHEEKSKLTDLMHEIVDSEQLAQWENALACYELAIQEVQRALVSKSVPCIRTQGNQRMNMQPPIHILDADALNDPDRIKPKLYSGLVGCFIQLGRLESALQQINGIVTVEPQFMATMYPLALECSWRLSRWELLTELLSAEKQNPLLHSLASDVDGARSMRLHGFDVSQLMRVRVLHSLHGGQDDEFQRHLRAARLDVMGPLAAASAESYQRAYPLLHDLHFLHEAEQGFIFLQKAGETEDLGQRSILWNKQTPWKMRYDSMAMQLKYREPILALRRVILHEAALRNEVGENWLLYAKLTRKEGFIRTAKSAVMHAEALENRYALIEKAKLLVRQDRMYEALRILEPVDIDASTFLDADVPDPQFCAKHLLLATNYMQQTGQRQGQKVIDRYQAVISYNPRWEKGYFYLAKYYEYLLSVTHPYALNGSMGSEEVAHLLVDSVFHDQLIQLLKNYVLALAHGTKFLFQSLPRLLTLWFDFGEVLYASASELVSSKANNKQRHVEIGPSQSVTEEQVLNDMTSILTKAIKCLPAYQWLVCFPQLTSRICHPNPLVVDGVKEIMLRVLAAYPTQAMWPLLGLSLSLNPQRRSRARDVITATQREFHSKGLNEIADSFSEGMRMAEELISLAAHDPGKGQRKIRIRLSRLRTQILLPLQEALTTILPASGLAPRDELHTAFSPDAQIYIKAFSDKADVMMTKEKPKRIEILGTDGHLYPFLCKREKYGDLRKDARMMEFNSMINKLLQKDREGRKRKLRLRTYAVVCLNEESGLMEWVKHTKAMRQLIGQIHKTERGYIPPVRLTNETKDLYLNMQKKFATDPRAMARFYRREVLSLPVFTPRFHQWFLNNFADPTAWFEARLAFSRSAAVWSMVGHIIGLGDRHGENILIDCTNGECVHVDFDCLFDKGLKLAIPEIVPFRLTPNMVDACGITGYEGVFRRVCEVTMHLLRNNKETLRSVLESFIHDPLVEWGRRGKTTQSHDDASKLLDLSTERSKRETRLVLRTIDDRLQGMYNLGAAIRPFVSSAHRRLLPEIETFPLSVEGQVEKLIHEATSHVNLAQMYIGWMPFL